MDAAYAEGVRAAAPILAPRLVRDFDAAVRELNAEGAVPDPDRYRPISEARFEALHDPFYGDDPAYDPNADLEARLRDFLAASAPPAGSGS